MAQDGSEFHTRGLIKQVWKTFWQKVLNIVEVYRMTEYKCDCCVCKWLSKSKLDWRMDVFGGSCVEFRLSENMFLQLHSPYSLVKTRPVRGMGRLCTAFVFQEMIPSMPLWARRWAVVCRDCTLIKPKTPVIKANLKGLVQRLTYSAFCALFVDCFSASQQSAATANVFNIFKFKCNLTCVFSFCFRDFFKSPLFLCV